MSSDRETVEEELLAVQAIFGDDCGVDATRRAVKVWIPGRDVDEPVKVTIHLGAGYPSTQAPVIELDAPQYDAGVCERLARELDDLFLPGQIAVFDIVQLLRERVSDLQRSRSCGEVPVAEVETCREVVHGRSLDAPSATNEAPPHDRALQTALPRVISGHPYTERKSTFQDPFPFLQAHVARVTSVAAVEAMMEALTSDSKIRRATHNMLAYRIALPNIGSFLQDYDDDGESAAGKRLLHLLQVADARNVCVCVSRWFGGVHLGPSRFAIISNTARALLVKEGLVTNPSAPMARK